VYKLQAARPAQSPFTADFVGQAESQRPLVRLGGDEGRRQALGEEQNFGPAGARPFVIVDQHWPVALADPLLQGFAVIGEPHGGPLDALDVEDAFGRFAPGAWHIADNHHAHAAAHDCFFHARVCECHRRLRRALIERYRQSSKT